VLKTAPSTKPPVLGGEQTSTIAGDIDRSTPEQSISASKKKGVVLTAVPTTALGIQRGIALPRFRPLQSRLRVKPCPLLQGFRPAKQHWDSVSQLETHRDSEYRNIIEDTTPVRYTTGIQVYD
jgi:hypothetical protein